MISTVPHHAVRVPATTANLGPGFDAFGLALDRYLVVVSAPRAEDRVTTLGEGADELPRGDENLVWRSLTAFCEEHRVPTPDVSLRVANDVPPERGLGSSSAAIVAGLVLGRALTRVVIGDRDLVALASRIEGHPDNVAPAVLGGFTACATDDAGAVVVRRVNPAPRLRPVAFVPSTRQATSEARASLPDALPRADVAVQAARAGHVVGALVGAWEADASLAGDRLHEPARRAVMPGAAVVLDALRSAGLHAWLSGAGPSVMALVDREWEPDDGVSSALSTHGYAARHCRVDLAGAVACPEGGCAFAAGTGCVHCPRERV